MNYIDDDGGRKVAGYIGSTGDCAVRAFAIATELPYQTVYDAINALGLSERTGKRKRGKSNARTGVYKSASHKYMGALGWVWHPTMQIGSGCKVHLRDGELPMGRLVVQVSKHFTAVIDGVIHDTHDPSRDGTRCVYGYWSKPRTFLPRPEATRLLGLVDAALRREPKDVRVACKDCETGEVYEAVGSEVLHAQIALRVGRAMRVIDGWTVPAGYWSK